MSILTTETVNEYAIRPAGARKGSVKGKGAITNLKNEESHSRDAELPRSASYTYMGDAKSKESSSLSLDKSSLSETDFTTPGDISPGTSPTDSTGVNTPDERFPEVESRSPQPRDLVFELEKVPQVEVRHLSNGSTKDATPKLGSAITFQEARKENANNLTTPKPRSSVASNFSRKLNRRPWNIGPKSSEASREQSPHKKDTADTSEEAVSAGDSSAPVRPVAERKKSFPKRKDSLKPQKKQGDKDAGDQTEATATRRSTVRRKKRPISGLFGGSSNDGEVATAQGPTRSETQNDDTQKSKNLTVPEPAKTSTGKSKRHSLLTLPKSFSTERLPTYSTPPLSPNAPPTPVPRLLSSERVAKSGFAAPKKKDELWGVFRNLDADFSKFNSKSVSFKANIVRTSLLLFLRTYATHTSSRKLRSEDLDRRANILNKWWTGLIELLHGRNNQSISGTDRPVILDGIAGIMERPEWKLPPSPLSPLNQRVKGTHSPLNRSTTSLTSEASDFLTESVHHNVRNIFIQNLTSQMAFVVDKMSLRNASASLVSFCGKACAYAFVFVPGMADILARLWDLHIDSLRRVLNGNGIGKFENLSDTSKGIGSSFPPALQSLAFTSLMKYMRMLRTTPPLPIGTAQIPWWGQWLNRWSGKESDLFYVFVKYFHILATDFLPSDSSATERMCAPGFLLVHAQILTNLDATIHRDANQVQQESGPSASFDEMFSDPDALATTLPLPPTNATRLMSENRLIMLIRDFLAERAGEYPIARRIFAESFNNLLQTSARGTSMFDHAACYTLLDFLEEAMVLLVRFEKVIESDESLVNLDFWITVWKKMIESQNTMTEIRLYAFLYTVWNTVICELGREQDLCRDALLDSEIFASQFNNWCPMVRSYFMRLLCWRAGRTDEESPEKDITILEMIYERLQTTWSGYLYLREQARQQDTQAPPTNPCNPAPSRRLLIIRTDPQISPPGAFLSFDGIVPPRTPSEATSLAGKRSSTISSISNVMEMHARPDSALSVSSDSTEIEARGRSSGQSIGGFIKNLIAPKSRGKSQSRSPSKPAEEAPRMPQPGQLVRAATDDLQSRGQPTSSGSSGTQTPQFCSYTFKFSLEYHPSTRALPPMRLLPPRLPLPAQKLLQDQSEKVMNASPAQPMRPTGESAANAKYSGRALAEWAVVLGECQSFFERRKNEGVPSNKLVETPSLGVEVFRRPG